MRLPAAILRLFNYSFIFTVEQAKGTHTILQLSERSVKGFILAGAASRHSCWGSVEPEEVKSTDEGKIL